MQAVTSAAPGSGTHRRGQPVESRPAPRRSRETLARLGQRPETAAYGAASAQPASARTLRQSDKVS